MAAMHASDAGAERGGRGNRIEGNSGDKPVFALSSSSSLHAPPHLLPLATVLLPSPLPASLSPCASLLPPSPRWGGDGVRLPTFPSHAPPTSSYLSQRCGA